MPLATNTSLWAFVGPTFTSKGYNLLLHDQRGHGCSSVPDPPVCTMKDLADDIATLLDHFGIRAHAVIGVSQGGAAVLQFALRHPSKTTRIIACDTQAMRPIPSLWPARISIEIRYPLWALACVSQSNDTCCLGRMPRANWRTAAPPCDTPITACARIPKWSRSVAMSSARSFIVQTGGSGTDEQPCPRWS